jgi:hypothetical protein
MLENICPNFKECRLVKAADFKFSGISRETYLTNYCEDEASGWKKCKRFIAKSNLGFCPDFVLPDYTFTTDEIIDKFDNEI